MKTLLLFLLVLGGGDEARQEYQKKVKEVPADSARALFGLAEWCQDQQLWDLAQKHYLEVIQLQPNYRQARAALWWRLADGWVVEEDEKEKWKYRVAVAGGVKFPPDAQITAIRKKSEAHSKIIDVFLDLENWVRALKIVHEATGLFEETLDIQLIFRSMPDAPAKGGGRKGKGKIWLDFDRLAEYQRQYDAFEGKLRPGTRIKIPPARRRDIITHELLHCFQGGGDFPAWFVEGMASYVAQDGHFLAAYKNDGKIPGRLEDEDTFQFRYARGWMFFEYFEENFGKDKVRKWMREVVDSRKDLKQSAAAIAGKSWETMIEEEKKWSQRWIRGYRIKWKE